MLDFSDFWLGLTSEEKVAWINYTRDDSRRMWHACLEQFLRDSLNYKENPYGTNSKWYCKNARFFLRESDDWSSSLKYLRMLYDYVK